MTPGGKKPGTASQGQFPHPSSGPGPLSPPSAPHRAAALAGNPPSLRKVLSGAPIDGCRPLPHRQRRPLRAHGPQPWGLRGMVMTYLCLKSAFPLPPPRGNLRVGTPASLKIPPYVSLNVFSLPCLALILASHRTPPPGVGWVPALLPSQPRPSKQASCWNLEFDSLPVSLSVVIRSPLFPRVHRCLDI